jgi:hypothetical protein
LSCTPAGPGHDDSLRRGIGLTLPYLDVTDDESFTAVIQQVIERLTP